ncbi:hypothetical protein AB4212_30705 [Streptomyces sp. 2MCAF27]
MVLQQPLRDWPGLDVEETDTGIDLGLSSYAVLRGRKIASPKLWFPSTQPCSTPGCGREHVSPRTPGQRSPKRDPIRSPAARGGAGGNHPQSRG